jgi:hypothetical protein
LKYKKINILNIIVYFINDKYEIVICLIGLPEFPNYGKIGINQYIILYFFLKEFDIIIANLGYFIFNNITNNDIIL